MAYQNDYRNPEEAPETEGRRMSAADYLISAKGLSKQIVDRGRKQADEITAEAEARAEEIVNQAKLDAEKILADARQQAGDILLEARQEAEKLRAERMIPAGSADQEHAVRCVEDCFARLRQHQQEAIDLLNEQWQQFLCSLYTEEEPAEESVPPDLSARVSAIAEAVEALEDSDE
ncbi:MAG: hypothetical protein J6A79_16895 [Clostridia bacterium]|nr:hypothetical protein [Clostridia bacterium]